MELVETPLSRMSRLERLLLAQALLSEEHDRPDNPVEARLTLGIAYGATLQATRLGAARGPLDA